MVPQQTAAKEGNHSTIVQFWLEIPKDIIPLNSPTCTIYLQHKLNYREGGDFIVVTYVATNFCKLNAFRGALQINLLMGAAADVLGKVGSSAGSKLSLSKTARAGACVLVCVCVCLCTVSVCLRVCLKEKSP